ETIGNSMHRTGMSVDHQPRPTPEWSEEHIADRRRSQNPSVSSSDCDLRGKAERRLLGQASPRRRSQGKEPAASPVNWIKLNGLGLSSETGCVVNEATLSGEAELTPDMAPTSGLTSASLGEQRLSRRRGADV